MRVRRAVEADAGAIRTVGEETWPATYGYAGAEHIARGLETWWSEEAVLRGLRTTETFVAEAADDEVIGMGSIDLRTAVPTIWKLYVRPPWQGTGAGSALMQALLAASPDACARLEYTAGNEQAAAFYQRQGFVETGREQAAAGGPDTVWMERR